ncbi:MAG: decaprenyl-phosphate phosphoribosyltransferase [Desulfatibacillaceae bacterium]
MVPNTNEASLHLTRPIGVAYSGALGEKRNARVTRARLERNPVSNPAAFIQAMRPRQWTKNGFILVPLLFARRMGDPESLANSLFAVGLFCLLSGGVYVMNDLRDLVADREHPVKRRRPIASGRISPAAASVFAAVLIASSLAGSFWLSRDFGLVACAYLAVQVLYTFGLKHAVILDAMCVSGGFFLRVLAGAEAIDVPVSRWLVMCALLISLFLALAKRRSEIILLGEDDAGNHRKVLSHYSPYLLDQMIVTVVASTLVCYLLYCVAPETVAKFGTDKMILTFPFVLYGMFRYLYLVHKKDEGGAPEVVLLTDKPLLACVCLWVAASFVIIYTGF